MGVDKRDGLNVWKSEERNEEGSKGLSMLINEEGIPEEEHKF
jgi:hypothetical protein